MRILIQTIVFLKIIKWTYTIMRLAAFWDLKEAIAEPSQEVLS